MNKSPHTASPRSSPQSQELLPSSMRAVVLDRYGSADQLQVREVPCPACDDDQVTVRVRAAGINPIDWRIRKGSLRWVLPARFPIVLGFDIAGQLVECGAAAKRRGWKPGDEVLGFLDSWHGGGYAEHTTIGARAIAPKPAVVSFEEAAAVPLAASTALQALRDVGRMAAGQEVLINGASGGVGSFAVQLGRIFDARVTGVCSGSNLEFVRELGAARVIDYTREDFVAQDRQYDIIFDAVAKSSYGKCRRALKPGGCYVTTVPSTGTLLFQLVTRCGRRCRSILARPDENDLRFLAQQIAEGELRPVVQQSYALDEAATAHQASEDGHVRGKLVLSLDAA